MDLRHPQTEEEQDLRDALWLVVKEALDASEHPEWAELPERSVLRMAVSEEERQVLVAKAGEARALWGVRCRRSSTRVAVMPASVSAAPSP